MNLDDSLLAVSAVVFSTTALVWRVLRHYRRRPRIFAEIATQSCVQTPTRAPVLVVSISLHNRGGREITLLEWDRGLRPERSALRPRPRGHPFPPDDRATTTENRRLRPGEYWRTHLLVDAAAETLLDRGRVFLVFRFSDPREDLVLCCDGPAVSAAA